MTERVWLAIFGAALVFAGTGFGGYGLVLALSPRLGGVGAAEATAAALLAIPLIYLIVVLLRPPPPVVPLRAPPRSELAILSVLATVARDRPLLAVLGAGLFGAADMLLKQRR
ncbi:MAG TPA: hypothetical protein VGG10_00805 [Rhizomicrobium sp.]